MPVSPSSVVTEFCDVFSCSSDWEDVVPQPFSFSKKCAHCCTSTQEEMRYEGSQGKASPMTRRRMIAHTSAKFVRLPSRGAGELRSGRPGMECEGKNDHDEDKTVSGKKAQCEGAS